MDLTYVPRPIDPESLVEMADGVVIKSGDTLHTLNVTGREIIDLFDGERTVADIIDEMEKLYPDDEAVKPAVEAFIGDLANLDIIKTGV